MHFIVPPTDEKLKQRLRLKLKEYQDRIVGEGKPWQYEYPELAHKTYPNYRDACYKAHVLSAVLESNEPVDTWKLSKEMHDKWKDSFAVGYFSVACGVIEKYCGGLPDQPLFQSTGLPELPKTEQ